MSLPHGRARVDPRHPEAFGTCDRCGFQYNLRDLHRQMEYNAVRLYDTGFRVCNTCLDKPQPQYLAPKQLRDPKPVKDPRPLGYDRLDPELYGNLIFVILGML